MASLCLPSGECTEVALDLDRGKLHVYHSASYGERGVHQVVPLSKVRLALLRFPMPRRLLVRLLTPGYVPSCLAVLLNSDQDEATSVSAHTPTDSH